MRSVLLVLIVWIAQGEAQVLAEYCVCSDGTNENKCGGSQNCSLGDFGGYCEIKVHINVSTQEPLFIEQKCAVSDGLLNVLDCRVPRLETHNPDVQDFCCEGELCNACPHELIVNHTQPKYHNALYDLFPEPCRPPVPSATSTTPLSSSSYSLLVMPESITFVAKTTVTVRATNSGPQSGGSDMDTYIIVFAVMVSLGILVVISVIVVFALIINFIKRGRRRRVTETPYCTNNAFLDFKGEESSCSSNALRDTRLLQARTLVDDVRFVKMLGRGRFGSVYLGVWGEEEIAVKVYDSHHETEWEREVAIYNTYMLTHANILKFISADKKETGNDLQYTGDTIHLLTCLEYHPNGNLQEYLEKKKCLKLEEGFALATSFLDGLNYLHKNVKTGSSQKPGIAHRDIKSPNILVKSNFTCCIGDLGLAIKQENDTGVDIVPTNKLSGTRRYLPPEVLDQTMNFERFQCYVSADIYSASLVLWEIFQCVTTDQGPSSGYKLPFYEHISHHPTLETMKSIVVTRGLRPSLKLFQSTENLSFLSKILLESWNSIPLARPSALNINKKLKNASSNLK